MRPPLLLGYATRIAQPDQASGADYRIESQYPLGYQVLFALSGKIETL